VAHVSVSSVDLVVGVARHSLPARDREQEIETGLIRHFGKTQIVGQAPVHRSGTMVTAPDEQWRRTGRS